MKKARHDQLHEEYRRDELGKGVRGKHLKAYQQGSNLVLLDPKVAAAFPTERAVNQALEGLIEVAGQLSAGRGVRESTSSYSVKKKTAAHKAAKKRRRDS